MVFIALGTLAGMLGSFVWTARTALRLVGGVLLMLFGLSMLGVFRIPFLQGSFQFRRLNLGGKSPTKRAFITGLILASGWTPCTGPVLGSILFLAASTATAATGAMLLGAFSLGMALPYLLIAVFSHRAFAVLARLGAAGRTLERVAGVFMLTFGFLFLTNRLGAFTVWAFKVLQFLNYDALLDYM